MTVQRDETFAVFASLAAQNDLPATATVDVQFVPDGLRPDWQGFKDTALTAGYAVNIYESDETIEISQTNMDLTAEAIWSVEDRLTQWAARYGFKPDGWGFFDG